jgi:transcriptional regulator with XRE-family HTH domain
MTAKQIRSAMSVTQQDLADALGVSPQTIAQWEENGDDIPEAHLKVLAFLYGSQYAEALTTREVGTQLTPDQAAIPQQVLVDALSVLLKKSARRRVFR